MKDDIRLKHDIHAGAYSKRPMLKNLYEEQESAKKGGIR